MFSKIIVLPLTITLLAATLLLQYGCGGDAVQQDTAAFEKAVATYLKNGSMDLKVSQFKELKVTGDTAEAAVSLAYAGEGVGVKVRWRFSFKQQDGQWVVTKHSE